MEPSKKTSVFLRDVANIVMGQSPAGSSYNPNEGIEFHQGKSYFGEVLLDHSPIKTTQPTKFAQDGDIVICVRAPVGIVNITDRKICIGRGLASISAKDSIDQRFLFYLIQSKKKVIEILASGSTFSCISGPQLSELMLDIPSKDKQSVISKALYSLEKHISNLEQLIRKQESIKKTTEFLLLQPRNSWRTIRVSECLDYEQPGKYIIHTDIIPMLRNIPVLTANKSFIIGYTEESDNIYDKGAVIIYDDFTMDMKYVTFAFKVKSSAIKLLTAKPGYDLYFIYSLLKQLNLSQQEHARSYISKVERMYIKIPDLDEQKQIAEQLKKLDQQLEHLRSELDKYRSIKNGLMDYFFG